MKKQFDALSVISYPMVFMSAVVLFVGAMLLLQSANASAAVDTCTWTGGGSDDNISTAANWTGCDNGNVPEDGDILAFDTSTVASGLTQDVTNTVDGFVVGGLQLTGAGSDNGSFRIHGSALELNGNISGDPESGRLYIEVHLTLGGDVNYAVSNGAVRFGSFDLLHTLDLQTYDITVDTTPGSDCTSSVVFASGLVGSGDVLVTADSQRVIFGRSSPGYTGSIVSNGCDVDISTGVFSADVTVAINGDGRLFLGWEEGTHAFNAIMNSTYDGANLITMRSGSGAGGLFEVAPNITFSGNLTLQQDTEFSGIANLNVTGTYTSNGNSLTITSGSLGQITTSEGTVAVPEVTTTIPAGDTSSASVYVVNKETVILNGSRGYVSVSTGGVLKGTGSAEQVYVNAGGRLAPGLSPGCMTVTSGGLTINGSYDVEIAGTTACSGYDQMVVTGPVDVTNGTLNVALLSGFVPALNNQFVIISNDGTDAVNGIFNGLAQGASVVVGGVTFHISYTGGDGNDVVLTAAAVPTTATVPDTGLMMLNRSVILPISIMFLSGAAVVLLKKKLASN